MKHSILLLLFAMILFSCKKETTTTTTTKTHQVSFYFQTLSTYANNPSSHKEFKIATYRFSYSDGKGGTTTENLVMDTLANNFIGKTWTKTVSIAEGDSYTFKVEELSYTDMPTVNGNDPNAAMTMSIRIDGADNLFYHGVAMAYTVVGHTYWPHTITGTVYAAP